MNSETTTASERAKSAKIPTPRERAIEPKTTGQDERAIKQEITRRSERSHKVRDNQKERASHEAKDNHAPQSEPRRKRHPYKNERANRYQTTIDEKRAMSALGCGLLVLGVWGAGIILILLGLREFGYQTTTKTKIYEPRNQIEKDI